MKKNCFQFFVAFIMSLLFAAAFELLRLPPMAIAFALIGVACLIVSGILFVIGQFKQ